MMLVCDILGNLYKHETIYDNIEMFKVLHNINARYCNSETLKKVIYLIREQFVNK